MCCGVQELLDAATAELEHSALLRATKVTLQWSGSAEKVEVAGEVVGGWEVWCNQIDVSL